MTTSAVFRGPRRTTPFVGTCEVLADVELSPEQAEKARKLIEQADSEPDEAHVSCEVCHGTRRKETSRVHGRVGCRGVLTLTTMSKRPGGFTGQRNLTLLIPRPTQPNFDKLCRVTSPP
jgi:hypothetical protein